MVKFEVGKWYTSKSWTTNSFVKFYKIRNGDKLVFTEYIKYGEYYNEKDWWRMYNDIREVSLSEIEEFLPKGHIDLQLKTIIYECW